MKNHWLEIHRKKKNKIWTAEFSKNGNSCLTPRQVSIISNEIHSGLLGQNTGRVSVVFFGAVNNKSDLELFNFLSESSQGGMVDMMSRLKKYDDIMSTRPVVCYQLDVLDYDSLSVGSSTNDLSLNFNFKSKRKIQLP